MCLSPGELTGYNATPEVSVCLSQDKLMSRYAAPEVPVCFISPDELTGKKFLAFYQVAK